MRPVLRSIRNLTGKYQEELPELVKKVILYRLDICALFLADAVVHGAAEYKVDQAAGFEWDEIICGRLTKCLACRPLLEEVAEDFE